MPATSELRTRVKRILNPDDDEDDPAIPPGILDLDEQEKVISTLEKADAARTAQTTRWVSNALLLPLPYVVLQMLLYPSGLNFWCMISIIIAISTRPAGVPRTEKDKRVAEKREWVGLGNLYLAAAICVYHWALWLWWGEGHTVGLEMVPMENWGLIVPVLIAATSYTARRLLIPTDFEQLRASTYQYLGA